MRIASNRRGISLMEAVVALVMVGMTAAGALGAAAAEMRTVERARRAIEAAALASQRVNMLHLLTPSELLSLPDSVARGRFDPPFEEYRWTTVVSNRERAQGVYNVTLQISWSDGSYTLGTAVYRPPVVMTAQ